MVGRERVQRLGIAAFFFNIEMVDAARRAGVAETHGARNVKEAIREMRDFLRAGDFVIVKGSRGVRLEQLVGRLLPEGGSA